MSGGSPGHAVMVADVAVNPKGEKVFLLLQSYMPAQEIHVIKNPIDGTLSPWYSTEVIGNSFRTMEWQFDRYKLGHF